MTHLMAVYLISCVLSIELRLWWGDEGGANWQDLIAGLSIWVQYSFFTGWLLYLIFVAAS